MIRCINAFIVIHHSIFILMLSFSRSSIVYNLAIEETKQKDESKRPSQKTLCIKIPYHQLLVF